MKNHYESATTICQIITLISCVLTMILEILGIVLPLK